MEANTDSQKIVVQHNDLINARFDMTTSEMRLFIAMLARLKRGVKDFETYSIPISDFTNSLDGGSAYKVVKDACERLLKKVVSIETTTPNNNKKRKYVGITLMSRCEYIEGSGFVEVKFNEEVKPYLLELTKNFTIAQIEQLMKLKSFYSYRIYWLLKQHQNFGERVIELDKLKEMLEITNHYKLYGHFKERVLLPVQKELETTDIPFLFEPLKVGRSFKKIKFTIKPYINAKQLLLSEPAWKTLLIELGIADYSIEAIEQHISENKYDENYILYVVKVMKDKAKHSKITTSLAGAIYTSVINMHLLTEYKESLSKKIYKHPLKQNIESAPQLIKLDYDEQQEIFRINKARGRNTFETFEDYLDSLLKDGFTIVDTDGRKALIKT